MATTDDLVISIRADIGALQSQLRNIDAQLQGTERQGNETANAIKNMALQFISLGAAIEGMKKLVDVNRNFGILKAGLETATGSIEGANQAFAALQQFAQQTPYDLAQTVEAFTLLVNLGLTPSERAMKSYGDTSAALGKDLKQMVAAVADAANGGFVRLEEFGIKFKNEGDNVKFTFKGVTETVKNNAASIEDYLIRLGEVNFAGAMTKRMESLDGAISNLGDAFEGFFYQIGESGATESLNSGIRKLGQGLTDLTDIVKQIPLSNFKSAMDAAGDAVLLFAGYKITKMVAGLALATQETIKNIAAQSAARVETLANAEADAIAANMAARRAIVEKQLALDELNRARATTASALATQQSAIADLEAAQLQSRLALGTQQATVANLARAIAAEKVTAAQLEVAAAANAESAAIARATIASAENTAASTANATAQQALATATTNATIAGRASGTMLTALGGPLGAIVTAIGLAAAAWLAFGDSAETAADKTKQAIYKIKNNLNITDDEAKALDDALKEVEQSIKSTIDSVRAASLSSDDKLYNALNKQLQELYNKKKEIEDTISRFVFNRTLDDVFGKTDSLEGFGGKKTQGAQVDDKKDQAPQVDDKKAAQEAKKLEQLKSAANAYLNQIAESNMSELQLEAKHFNEQLQQLEKYLQQKAITKSQYDAAVLDANSAFNNKIFEQLAEQQAKEDELALKKQEREDEDRSRRMEQIQGIINEANLAGMTELERMDAQHAAKMEKIAQLAEGESIYKQELRDAELILEQEHQAKRLDMILGTGSKIQNMTKAFQKGQLQGAVSFFAADFGGLSQHSRKLFELTKAARLAEAAINVPSTVMKAYEFGTGIGGPIVGAAFGAAALAAQLSQLKAIQSASFGGSSSGGGGGASASSVAQSQQPQQPLQQRFVNLNLYGGDNTMYSKDSVRTLIQRIGEEVKDGAVLRVS